MIIKSFMKKLFTIFTLVVGYAAFSQNTIPTTTVVGALSVNDSLQVSNNIHATGDIKTLGEMIVGGNAKVANNIKVNGTTDVKRLNVSEKIVLPGNVAISSRPNTTNGTTEIIIGPSTDPGVFPDVDQCSEMPLINSTLNYQNGKIQFWGTGSYGTRALTMGFDGNQGFIDAAGGGYAPNANKLLINYYCGKDIYMCTGTGYGMTSFNPNGNRGGVVSMGPNVEIGMPQRDMNIGLNMIVKSTMQKALMINSSISGGTVEVFNIGAKGGVNIITRGTDLASLIPPDALTVFHIGKNRNVLTVSAQGEVLVNTENGFDSPLNIKNVSLGKSVFRIESNGMTQIGLGKPKAGGQAADAMLSVDGLILAKEIKVAIAATHWVWPDYVFEKNYKLPSLKEVEKYINSNKHLPGVPSAIEVEEGGVNLAENNALLLKKIEELTLYLIEQNKRIEKLEKENGILKTQK